MNDRRFPVSAGGKTYSPEFQTEAQYAKGWKTVLESIYGTYALCLCPGRGERKLSIKRREDSDSMHLARFAGTGSEHAHECRYFSAAPDRSGLLGYTAEAIKETDEGLRIHLERGLQIRQASGAKHDTETVDSNRAPGFRKPAVSLLGLLHVMWTTARLNIWYPRMAGRRNADLIAHHLRKVAATISVGRLTLDEVLLLPANKGSKNATENATVVQRAAERKLRTVIIAPLARIDPKCITKIPITLSIAGPFGMPNLRLREGIWNRVQRRFGRELGAWHNGAKVIAIALFDTRMGHSAVIGEIIDIALMRVTERWIPIDSEYEGIIESRLHAANRSFEKPLRYDAEEDVFFPDFWLLDTGQDTPLEVFGMNTPDYLDRKREKTAWLDRKFGQNGWWNWDAAVDPKGLAIPDFPPAHDPH